MQISQVMKREGGMKNIKQIVRGGGLITSAGEVILLGKKKKALEITRLALAYKCMKKLKRKYEKYLREFDELWISHNHDDLLKVSSNKVWFCWFQGIDNAPTIVQRCYEALVKNLSDKEIIVLTNENLDQYVDFPPYVYEKWKEGIITNTHMTDLLRLELLIKYGGTWVDATVFCSGNNIPDYFFDSDLFLFQCLKPGRDGHSRYISSWFISAKTNNKVLMAVRYLLYKYWEKNKKMLDYFLLHDFFSIVLEYYPDEWKKIVPFDNSTPHILLLRLFEIYDNVMWEAIKEQIAFHKLTYKFDETKTKLEGTYYGKLFGNN